MNYLYFQEIVVDQKMTEAIENCHEDVVQLRRSPDGTYTPVEPKGSQLSVTEGV